MGAKIATILWIVGNLVVVTFSVMLLALDVMTYGLATGGARITAILWIVADLVFFTGYVAMLALDVWIVREVNRSVTEGHRLNYCRWSWDTPRAEELHKQLFPDSKLRRVGRILAWTWVPFALISWIRIRMVDDWPW